MRRSAGCRWRLNSFCASGARLLRVRRQLAALGTRDSWVSSSNAWKTLRNGELGPDSVFSSSRPSLMVRNGLICTSAMSAVPAADVFVQVEAEHVAAELRDLLGVGADAVLPAEHPAVLGDVRRHLRQQLGEGVVVAGQGEDAGHAGVERLARAQQQHVAGGGPGVVGVAPGRQRLGLLAGQDAGVGAQGQRGLAEDAADLVDQRAVQRDGGDRALDQRADVLGERGPGGVLLVAGEAGGEIGVHPVRHQRRVERALAAQDEVDLERLVQEVGVAEVGLHLGLEPGQQPGQQQRVQRAGSRRPDPGRRASRPGTGRSRAARTASSVAVGVAAGQGAQGGEGRQHRRQRGVRAAAAFSSAAYCSSYASACGCSSPRSGLVAGVAERPGGRQQHQEGGRRGPGAAAGSGAGGAPAWRRPRPRRPRRTPRPASARCRK